MSDFWTKAVRSPWRWSAALFLVANAAIHFALTPEHLEEAPYIGVLFIALSVACVVLAIGIVAVDSAAVWIATGAVSLAGLAALVASRTIGLPQIADEVGNWSDPWGTATILVEVAAIALAGVVLRDVIAHRPPQAVGANVGFEGVRRAH